MTDDASPAPLLLLRELAKYEREAVRLREAARELRDNADECDKDVIRCGERAEMYRDALERLTGDRNWLPVLPGGGETP